MCVRAVCAWFCVCAVGLSLSVSCAHVAVLVSVCLSSPSQQRERERERETERERDGRRERQRKREICRCLNASPMRLQPRPCNTMQQGLPCVHIPMLSDPRPSLLLRSHSHLLLPPTGCRTRQGQPREGPVTFCSTTSCTTANLRSPLWFCFPSYFLLCCSPCLSRLANTISHT